MIKSRAFLTGEFLLLFVLLPLSLAAPMEVRKFEGLKFRIHKNLNWSSFLKRIGITFSVIIIVTILFVRYKDPSALFYVPLNNPLLFITILLFYSLLSVWPQEIIYRTFFFERYASLFQTKFSLVLVNAVVFSLAHLFFKNFLVIVLTFIGGILFGLTYIKYKSTTLVSIEHALYGNWLFTVGMGEMLAFPGMENSSTM